MKFVNLFIAFVVSTAAAVIESGPDPPVAGVVTAGTIKQELISLSGPEACRKMPFQPNSYNINLNFNCNFFTADGCAAQSLRISAKGPATGPMEVGALWYACNGTGTTEARDTNIDVHALHADEEMENMVATIAQEQCFAPTEQLADPESVDCGTVRSWAPIPPFKLTTFAQCRDCNLILYGGVGYDVKEGCTCEFYFMPCDKSRTLVKVVGPAQGDIPRDRAYGYTCVAIPIPEPQMGDSGL